MKTRILLISMISFSMSAQAGLLDGLTCKKSQLDDLMRQGYTNSPIGVEAQLNLNDDFSATLVEALEDVKSSQGQSLYLKFTDQEEQEQKWYKKRRADYGNKLKQLETVKSLAEPQGKWDQTHQSKHETLKELVSNLATYNNSTIKLAKVRQVQKAATDRSKVDQDLSYQLEMKGVRPSSFPKAIASANNTCANVESFLKEKKGCKKHYEKKGYKETCKRISSTYTQFQDAVASYLDSDQESATTHLDELSAKKAQARSNVEKLEVQYAQLEQGLIARGEAAIAASQIKDYKGLQFGSKPTSDMKLAAQQGDKKIYQRPSDDMLFAGIKMKEVGLKFYKDQLVIVTMIPVNGSNPVDVLAKLENKFKKEGSERSRYGGYSTLAWTNTSTEVELSFDKYQGKEIRIDIVGTDAMKATGMTGRF